MPLYEYSCRSCGERFEILQRLGENGDHLACPACDHSEVEKVFSTFAAGAQSAGAGPGPAAQAAGCCRGTPT